MKFSVNWLREFVELPPSVEELADLLTMAGIEIEGIEKRGANFDSVRQLCARQRERNFVADFVIGRATNDLAFRAAAVVHFANCQSIGIRMAR